MENERKRKHIREVSVAGVYPAPAEAERAPDWSFSVVVSHASLPWTCTTFWSLLCLRRGCSLAGRRSSGYPTPHLISSSNLLLGRRHSYPSPPLDSDPAPHQPSDVQVHDPEILEWDLLRSTGPGDEICGDFGGARHYCDDLCTFTPIALDLHERSTLRSMPFLRPPIVIALYPYGRTLELEDLHMSRFGRRISLGIST